MSKIEMVKPHPVVAPLKYALSTAQETRREVALILVEIRTDDGITGIGQISDKGGAGTQIKEICAYLERFGELVAGMDALACVAIWEKLFALTAPRAGGGGLPRDQRSQIMSAIGGIDMALWDVLGKASNKPIFRLLGGENKPVFTYATGGYYFEGGKPTAGADQMAQFVADGFKGVKLKTGGAAVKDEVARVKATRDAIGDDIRLMLDMSGAYDLTACIEFAHAVAPYNIVWLEEPLHWYYQPADFVRLAQASSVALAHGEREMTRFTARDFITSGAIRYMQFDATRYAGLTEALRVAHVAEQHGVMIAPHHAPELHCHLVAAFPRAGYGVESHGSPDRDPVWHGIYKDRAQVRDGHVHMSEKPGFGFEIDWAFAERHKP